jgi:hypothetical protein
MRNTFGYVILWLMGIPLTTLLLIWVVSVLVGR